MPDPTESYDAIRLETQDETVICYFAPVFEVTPQDQNEVFEAARGSDRSTIVRDNGLWTSELDVQGSFYHSDEVGAAFRSALQDLFGQDTVTPDDQINRLRSYTVYDEPGALSFFHRDNEYTLGSEEEKTEVEEEIANDLGIPPSEVDAIEYGYYPVVSVRELRMPEEGETSTLKTDFTVKLSIGFERS